MIYKVEILYFYVLLLVLPGFLAIPAQAQTSAPNDLESLARTYKASRDELLQNDTQKRQILGELYLINEKMKSIDKKKARLTDEMLSEQSRIEELSANIATLEKTTSNQKEALTRRLRVMYKFSGQGFVKTLFSNSTSAEVDRFLKFLKIVSERDYHLMREYQGNIARFKVQKSQLTKEVKRLAVLKGRIKGQEDQLLSQNKASKSLLAQIDAKRLNQMVELQRLRSRTQQAAGQASSIDSALLKLLQPSFFEQKGLLPPPVNGPIVQKFGYFTDPEYKIRVSHKGVFFQGRLGGPVIATFEGTVSFADWLDGFGYTIILDHGHHYYTVYAYNSELKVHAGDHVKQGQQIAKIGSGSTDFGPGLYFEVRHFSEPEDPYPWLKSSSVQISRAEAY